MTAAPTDLARQPAPNVAMDRPAPNAKTIMGIMAGMSDRLASVATKHLTPEKLLRMIGVQMQRVPKLGQCTPISVLDCAMTCAELGLAPGVLGDMYLIPYGPVCTAIIGYKGLMKLARRSGEISTIQAEVVREGDYFEYRLGMDAALQHVPKAPVEAKMTHVWALAKLRDGSFQFAVLRAPEVEAVRKRSKAANNGPWVTDTAAMWQKTALRRLCKMLPLTVEIEEKIAKVDSDEFEFEDLGMAIGTAASEDERPTTASIADAAQKQLDEAKGAAPEKATEPAVAEWPDHCVKGKPGCSDDISGTVCSNHAQTGDGTLPGMTPEKRSMRKR